MDFLNAASLPWLEAPRRRLLDAAAAGRLPHAIMLSSVPGLGAEHLANWLAAVMLCDADAGRPCGRCASCLLLRADSHPDYHLVRTEEDAQQIKVDQIRALIEGLTLSSYRGGYKIGIVEGAEALNANGANAFLKTLEEPTANTLLILVARPSHRLPATIASRCLRLALRPPAQAEALAWLATRNPGVKRWQAALALAGGAPLRALELETAGIGELELDMQEGLKELGAGAVDVTLLAERWVKADPVLRLTWLENWITQRVLAAYVNATSVQSAEPARLPAALLKAKIRALFELQDAARELRRLSQTGLNQQLALEGFLLGSRAALTK